jgi:hypothetical protein
MTTGDMGTGRLRFASLDEAAAAAADIPYRHLSIFIEHHDKSEFNRRLARLLDNLARVKAKVLSVSTTTVEDEDGLLRVAHLVVVMGHELIDSFEGNDTGYIPTTAEGADRLIGFEIPQRSGNAPL